MLRTGRYLRFSENQQLGNLHLSFLQGFGVPVESYASSSAHLQGLDGGASQEYRERPFDSWIKLSGGKISVQGHLVMSEDLDEGKTFYVEVAGREPVRVDVGFRDFHNFKLAYHVGTPITLTGNREERNGQLLMTKVSELRLVLGKSKPGGQAG